MSIVKLNNENFDEEVIKSNKTVIVDFYADWCGPCKMMSPILEDIAQEVGDKVKICKINVDENRDLALNYDIMSIPTLIIFKNGNIIEKMIGLRDKQEILNSIL